MTHFYRLCMILAVLFGCISHSLADQPESENADSKTTKLHHFRSFSANYEAEDGSLDGVNEVLEYAGMLAHADKYEPAVEKKYVDALHDLSRSLDPIVMLPALRDADDSRYLTRAVWEAVVMYTDYSKDDTLVLACLLKVISESEARAVYVGERRWRTKESVKDSIVNHITVLLDGQLKGPFPEGTSPQRKMEDPVKWLLAFVELKLQSHSKIEEHADLYALYYLLQDIGARKSVKEESDRDMETAESDPQMDH